MRNKNVQKLIDAVESLYGPVSLYGSNELEENETCFIVEHIKVTFSVIMNTQNLETVTFSIQIEGQPPGDYLYALDECSQENFLQLVKNYKKPMEQWPHLN